MSCLQRASARDQEHPSSCRMDETDAVDFLRRPLEFAGCAATGINSLIGSKDHDGKRKKERGAQVNQLHRAKLQRTFTLRLHRSALCISWMVKITIRYIHIIRVSSTFMDFSFSFTVCCYTIITFSTSTWRFCETVKLRCVLLILF